ncbi:MAG: flavodoxin domain-containing protein [candidate division WOR-3 bacterium]|nr:flavodoxin domain-containing protein [candidate division WOR-3 bacterium]
MTDTSRKVLVAYATWAGSTADVAERIAGVLNRNGFTAEAVRAKEVRHISPYGAVVLGSSVHAGKLHPDALKFARRNAADLGSKPFATFVVCLAMKGNDEKARATAGAYLEPVRLQVKPLSEGLFAGAYDPSKAGFVERQIMKMIKAPPGDSRKWDEVEAWAATLAPLFAAGRAAGGR